MGDSYRPEQRRAPPKGPNHAPERRAPPMYRFGGDSWRGQARDARPAEFSFGSEQAPRLPDRAPAHQERYRDEYPRKPRRDFGARLRRDGRPFRPKVATSERPLLQGQRQGTPDQLEEMHHGGAKYLDLDDIEDSDEEDMDLSESDQEEEPKEGEADSNKKQELTAEPKWSNPEVYTSLPPMDEADRKRRDFVKMIRKARTDATDEEEGGNFQNQGDDFISFGDDEPPEDSPTNSDSPATPEERFPNNTEPAVENSAGMDNSTAEPLGQLPAIDILQNEKANSSRSITAEAEEEEGEEESAAKRLSELSVSQKRKRDIRDVGKPYAPKIKTGKRTVFSTRLQPEWDWNNRDVRNSLPWTSGQDYSAFSWGFRLHREICDFYEFVRPQHHEAYVRDDLVKRLDEFVKKWNSSCSVESFGSFAAGLYLPNADMDLVVLSENFRKTGVPEAGQSANQMHNLRRRLEKEQFAVTDSVQVIAKARVPLIKFVDRKTRLRIDLSFESMTGVIANETFQAWKAQFPAMPIIVTVIKQYLMMHGMNEVVCGGLGGFSVTCLVVSFLQMHPRVQNGKLNPSEHLGEVLVDFLHFYGNCFDYHRVALCFNPPGYVPKIATRFYTAAKVGRLSIIDPNKPENDVSGGSSEIGQIFAEFAQVCKQLQSAIASRKAASCLECMLRGNYNDFMWYRDNLQKIYDKMEKTDSAKEEDT